MAQTQPETPILPKEIELAAVSQTGSSFPTVLQRRNSDYIKAGERSDTGDPGYHSTTSSTPAAFNLQRPSNEEVSPTRAARTTLPSQQQTLARKGFANAFVEDWLSRTENSSDDTSSTPTSGGQLAYNGNPVRYSQSPTSNRFRPINGNSLRTTRRQHSPIGLTEHHVAIPSPAINVVYCVGDPVLALLQMQKDDADLALEPQKSQPAASSPQMPTVSSATLATGCMARRTLKRKSSSTDTEPMTTDKRARFIDGEETTTAPEGASGHLGAATTVQPEENQRKVSGNSRSRARLPRAKAAAIVRCPSNPPASGPVPTFPVPSPICAPISTTDTIANLTTATVITGIANGPATANYSQLIPKILRSFPAKGYTLPLSEIYGQIDDWKRSHGITIPIVKQSIRASLNRLQDMSSNTATVEHVKAPGARTGKWRLRHPQDWQPLIAIPPGNAPAASAQTTAPQVTVPGTAPAGAAGPSHANAADDAARGAQMMAAEALTILGAIEVHGKVCGNLQATAPTAALHAASAQDPIQRLDAGNENPLPGGPTTMRGTLSVSNSAVGYPSPSASSLEINKLAIQSLDSFESSSANLSQENPLPSPGTSLEFE